MSLELESFKDLDGWYSEDLVPIERRATHALRGGSAEAEFHEHAHRDVETLLALFDKLKEDVQEAADVESKRVETAEDAERDADIKREDAEAKLEETEKLLELARERIAALESAAAAKPVSRTRKKAVQ